MTYLTFGDVLERLSDAEDDFLVLAHERHRTVYPPDVTVHPLDVTVGQLRRDLEALKEKDRRKLFAMKVMTEDVGLVSVIIFSVEIGIASVILGIAMDDCVQIGGEIMESLRKK